MAKVTFSTVVDNTSNAGFQAWATELHTQLLAAGLVQTADTGQLATPVVAARPANGAFAGYWIFRFDDSLQGTAPIFIRVEPGRGSGGNSIAILCTIGTGTNGAGTITGVVMPAGRIDTNAAPTSTATPYATYINHDEGFFGLAWKVNGSGGAGLARLFICRTCDDNGDPTADGYWIERFSGNANGAVAWCGIWGGVAYGPDTTRSWSVIPFGVTNSAVGSDFQVFKVYGVYPQARIVPQLVVVVAAELAVGNTTGPVEIIDGVTRNYISLSGAGVPAQPFSVVNSWNYAMKWD
jgi:hypothetical protein